MAYFPNGTSGMIYEEEYCANCIHGRGPAAERGCMVMLIHNLFNYDQCKEDERGKAIEAILDLLIPRTKDDLGAEQCTMFRARVDDEAEEAELRRLAEQPRKYAAATKLCEIEA
jgi:hypothetical protein